MTPPPKISWPDGRRFGFTIFDDPDSQTLEAGKAVYGLLADLGFRTTKGVWPVRGAGTASDHGGTCAEPAYREWTQELQRLGFEIGLHNVAPHTSTREECRDGLDRFRALFGAYPSVMAQHYYCAENLYWGDKRLSGLNRAAYNAATRGGNYRKFFGDVEGHPYYWGDLCRERIKYVRNFVFPDINTLKACPFMPYHDPDRPAVNYWYASSEGAKAGAFIETIRECEQERLEEEGGACIMYTHFGHGYWENGSLNARFRDLMARLSRRNGWFVPVSTLLDYLRTQRADVQIRREDRARLERRWLLHKFRHGTA